ncbi:tetratricopeptide repeat protein [Tsukamurella sp. 1534]|uniref:tetratricopeptide repeat protein n=1 Tax=Tsukamurella sp. 1534 TaxID=1151061 RepID=UPI0002E241F7|nr:tetratricopeptide repeat protein [Tsukamurella sp. 1534]
MTEHGAGGGSLTDGAAADDDAASGAESAHTLQKIDLLLEAKQYESAAALAGAYLAAHPDDVGALVALGDAQEGLGRDAEAVASLQRALAVEPMDYRAAARLAYALRRQGRLPEALHTARTLVRLHPDVWGSHHILASVYLATKNRALAHEAYAAAHRAVALEPGEPENHVVLGLAARAIGDQETARRANEQALHLDPNNSAALNNRGTVMKRFRRGNWGEQVETYARSAAQDPHDPVARYNLEVTAFNTFDRTGWFVVLPLFVAIVASVIASRPSGGAVPPAVIAAVVGVVLVVGVWGAWAAYTYRRIPAGRHRMLADVVRRSGPARTLAGSLLLLAVVMVAVIPLSLVAPGIGAVLLPLVFVHRLVEMSTRFALRRRHPDRR